MSRSMRERPGPSWSEARVEYVLCGCGLQAAVTTFAVVEAGSGAIGQARVRLTACFAAWCRDHAAGLLPLLVLLLPLSRFGRGRSSIGQVR